MKMMKQDVQTYNIMDRMRSYSSAFSRSLFTDIIKYGDCFDSSTIMEVQRRISTLDDTQAPILMSMNLQKPTIILIIAIFLGLDRFFLDDIVLGIIKVLICWGGGIWWLIDIFTAKRRTFEYNYKKFNETMMLLGR